jgi:hypothetical protein
MFEAPGLGPPPASLLFGAKPPIRLEPGREIFGGREKFGGLEIPGPPRNPPPAAEGGMNPPGRGPILGGGPGGGPGRAIAFVSISSGKAPTTKADILSSFNFIGQ